MSPVSEDGNDGNCSFGAVYFGGLGELFFNKAMETTVLERITGTVSMFLFPIIIYFCIFSFMACSIRLACSCFLEVHELHLCSTDVKRLPRHYVLWMKVHHI